MKTKIGCLVGLLILVSMPAFTDELEIEGQRYAFRDIVAKTTLENGLFENPLDGKVVTVRFIPGWRWSRNRSDLVKRFWPLAGTLFRVSFSGDDFEPAHVLTEQLVAEAETPHGTVTFEMRVDDFAVPSHLARAKDLLETVLRAIEWQRENLSATVIEMTGRIHFSGYVDSVSGETKLFFLLSAESARVTPLADVLQEPR